MAQLPEMRCARREDAVGPHRYRGFDRGGSDEPGDDLVGAELGLRRHVGVRRGGVAPGHGEARRGGTGHVVTKATQGRTIVGVHRGTSEYLEAGEFECAVLPRVRRDGGPAELAARACGELQGRECGVSFVGRREPGEGRVYLAGDDGEVLVPGRLGGEP